MNLIVNSDESLQRAIGALRQAYLTERFLRIAVKTGKDRSLDQNAGSHLWYAQLARELPQETELGWKCFCKLNFGVPILRQSDEEFKQLYDSAIRKSLTYEQKLAAMRVLPVTSRMNVKQKTEYLKLMQEHFAKQHRVILEFL